MFQSERFTQRFHPVEAQFLIDSLALYGVAAWPELSVKLGGMRVTPIPLDREDTSITVGIVSVIDKEWLQRLVEDKGLLENARKKRDDFYERRQQAQENIE